MGDGDSFLCVVPLQGLFLGVVLYGSIFDVISVSSSVVVALLYPEWLCISNSFPCLKSKVVEIEFPISHRSASHKHLAIEFLVA